MRPLRGVRWNLKTFGDHRDFRDKVESLELAGEQIEQAILYSSSLDRWHRNCFCQPEASVRTDLSRLLERIGAASAGKWPARLVKALLQQSDKLQP